MVSKEELLKYATDQAVEETDRRNLDSLATKELLAEAREIIEGIFFSINWRETERNTVNSKNPLTTWRHRTLNDRETDWRYMSFANAELQHIAKRYLQASWLHCQTLDWLVLNTLAYGDYLAMLDRVRAHTMPLSHYQSRKSGKINFRVLAELWRAALLILKITAWFIIFAAVSPASPIGPLLWIGLTGWWLWRNWTTRKRNNTLLNAMFSTYTALSTTYQSWPKIREELKKSQELGALWNSLVYQLVEEKMQQV
jgi:hypothetical protein